MKLEMRGQMRMEQKMKLAPHMIQSMEILQLPILALQERLEQELNNNPVLEIEEPAESTEEAPEPQQEDDSFDEGEMNDEKIEDFGKFDSLEGEFSDNVTQSAPISKKANNDEPDKKLEAIKNTEAMPQSLHEYLIDQWRLVDAEDSVKTAGELIIDYIDNRGYLSVRLEQLHNKDRKDFNFEDLQKALQLVQQLEPAGIGARSIKECLLIQMEQNPDFNDFDKKLISECMDELLENHMPDIARKLGCSIEKINHSIEKMSKLDTSPGTQINQQRNHPITADVIVEKIGDSDEYSVRLANTSLPNLRINDYYSKISRDNNLNEDTRKYLQNNMRSAQWIIDAIEQRKSTLLKVTRAVVKYQKEFFDKGQLHLKPLPMSRVADEVGVHLATVSRAVAGKYVQCFWGVLPLRKFFSGGTEDSSGKELSWEAIRGKLQQIIDSEDKSKPLSDDQIRKKLAEQGITNLARRTVAKYRKLMNIPAGRFRKKY